MTKLALSSSGLGEKHLKIPFDSTAEQLHQGLNLFPPLSTCGGYELLKCAQDSRHLVIIPPSGSGYTPTSLATIIGQSRIYICPLQRDITLASSFSSEPPRERCMKCLQSFPIAELWAHVAMCTHDSDDDFEIPRRLREVARSTDEICSLISSCSPPHPGSIPSDSIQCDASSSHEHMESTPQNDQRSHLHHQQQTPACTSLGTPSPPASGESLLLDCDNKIGIISEMFPNISDEQVQLLLQLCGGSAPNVCTICLKGCSVKYLLNAFKSLRLSTTVNKITIDPNNIFQDALRVYKMTTLNIDQPLEIVLQESLALDLGGPRRFFFDTLLSTGSKIRLFEGDQGAGNMLPCVNHDAIIGGMFRIFGKILVHSLLNDGPGFPFLAPPLYHYIVGTTTEAVLPYLDTAYLPVSAKVVIDKIQEAQTNDELYVVSKGDDCLELLANSGCLATLTVSTKHAVIQNMLYEILLKRKLQMDEIIIGLSSLDFLTLVRTFPEQMKPILSGGAKVPTAEELISILKFPREMSEEGEDAATNLQAYIFGLDMIGKKNFLRFY